MIHLQFKKMRFIFPTPITRLDIILKWACGYFCRSAGSVMNFSQLSHCKHVHHIHCRIKYGRKSDTILGMVIVEEKADGRCYSLTKKFYLLYHL